MTRVKGSVQTKARHKKVLKKAEGYFGSKHRLYKTAKEQIMHSERYAYRDRKQKKRDFRKLWITRINAECRNNDISYSRFIDGLSKAGVEVNRKMLSELAINDKEVFATLVKIAKTGKIDNKKITVKEVKIETVKKEDKPVKEEKVTNDINKLTVAELKALAKDKKIAGYTTMKKADLIALLK